jgi:hypothetical protein
VLALGQVQQLCHPDACAHLELGEPADTIMCVTVRKESYHTINIAYRWWGKVVMCRVVIGHDDVRRVLHLAWHSHISHRLRDALPMVAFLVVTSHVRVLTYNTYGKMATTSGTVKNTTRRTWARNWWRAG